MTLANLRTGQSGVVKGFVAGSPSYRQRLLAMGLTPGTAFSVVRVAPLGDPFELSIRGYSLSLRAHEAAVLQVSDVA
ncbi:FeoA family protein [Chitinibacteraceae bacterium HSL-7]